VFLLSPLRPSSRKGPLSQRLASVKPPQPRVPFGRSDTTSTKSSEEQLAPNDPLLVPSDTVEEEGGFQTGAMPPQPNSTQPQIVRTLRSLVWYNLDNNLLPSAVFIAERLLAQDSKSAEAHHLLALCYYRTKQLKSAEHTALKAIRHLGCAYIYAQCCLELNNGKEKHGINVLEKCKSQWAPQQSWSRCFSRASHAC
jgi:hypothetical protein